MATEVLMPKLGLTMTEGTIEEWRIKEGQPVKKGEVLFSVATDKLTNDVEADADGVLLKILLPEGETASCKSVVAYIGQPGEAIPGVASGAAPLNRFSMFSLPAAILTRNVPWLFSSLDGTTSRGFSLCNASLIFSSVYSVP